MPKTLLIIGGQIVKVFEFFSHRLKVSKDLEILIWPLTTTRSLKVQVREVIQDRNVAFLEV